MILEYKGYKCQPCYCKDDNIYYGRIIGIKDMVDFYTKDINNIEKEFYSAVDDYIEFKKECDIND